MMAPRGRVAALFLMELRTLLRDRRTVVLSIVMPLLVMPVMLFASRWVEVRRQHVLDTRESSYAVTGPRAEEARALVERARALTRSGTDERERHPLIWRETHVADPDAALTDDTLDFYVVGGDYAAAAEALPHTSANSPADTTAAREDGARSEASRAGSPTGGSRASRQERQAIDVDDPDTPPPDLLTISVVYRSDRDTSSRPADRLVSRLREVRTAVRDDALTAVGSPTTSTTVLPVSTTDVADASQVAGLTVGRLLTLMLVFFLLSGGAVVAQDTLAGEKERGTLETLLTSAISRREIVTAKVLLVLMTAVAITTIQVINLLIYVGFGLIPTTQNLSAAVTPLMAAGLLVFLLPVAALVAGVLVLVSGYARSYREAQLYFLPVMLVGAIPAAAAFLPGISLRSAVALVPVANISVGVKEILVGRVDWLMLAVAWLVTATTAAATIRAAAQLLSTERLIVPTLSEARRDGGVRPGQVGLWFAVMWAVMLVVSLNLGEDFDIRAQLVVNLIGIFLGGSLLFLRYHRLDPVEVLSLRAPHPAAWLAVLFGMPSGLIVGVGIFRLSQWVVPVPPEMLRHFGEALMPPDVPMWQLLPLMTILPGICEETAFRGVLLYGLRRRLPAPASILLVGLIFGLFHFSLFRVLQTGYLGVILASVTVLTGSIFPAMVWHAGSNALALTSAQIGFSLGAFEPATYGAAAMVLACCFWILWRTRPGGATPAAPSHGALPMAMLVATVGLQTAGPLSDGRAALAKGDVAAAVAAADKVLARTPTSEEALGLKLEALAEAKDWETGLGAYDTYVAAGGKDRVALLQALGRGYLRETVAFYPTLRHNALGRLACSGDRDALLQLRREKGSLRPDDVDGLSLAARLGDSEAVTLLQTLSLNGPMGLRASALQALQQLRDRGAEQAVLEGLDQPDLFVRLAALRASRALMLEAAIPLLKVLTTDRNPHIVAEALASLAVLGQQEALDRLPALTSSPSVDLRVAALSGLAARAPTPQVLDDLLKATQVRSGLAWIQAIDELIVRDRPRAATALRAALDDPNPNVRVQALRLASRVPMVDPEDLARLRGMFRDNNLFVRLEAATVAVGQGTMCGG